MEQQQYMVGAYCRLSRDDENIGESGSITMQKEIIKQYCNSIGLTISHVYQDDGYTGLNFDRPDFQRMVEDIGAGKIDCVITKDLSRLGRDYIMTGYYTEIFFPENKVRYIAIGDGYDTQDKNNSNNDFAPFKFIMNDMYAKDLSKKQRASRMAKSLNKEYVAAYAPYGYKKDPDQKNHLIIDEETAPTVKMIFEMYTRGMGQGIIRDFLYANKIPTPLAVLHLRGQRYEESMEIEDNRYQWSRHAISVMLKNEVYIGNAVHLRNRKATHKSKMRRQSKEDYLIIKDTHEPLITMETWESVKKYFRTHADTTYVHENIFMGLVKCMDCGKSLNYGRTPRHPKIGKRGKEQKVVRYLTCATYSRYGKQRCTSHYMSYDMLGTVVQERLNRMISMVKIDEGKVRAKILKERKQNDSLADETAIKKVAKNEKRLGEITRIYTKLYEDRVLEIVSDENFRMLSDKLQTEQKQLAAEIESIRILMADKEKSNDDIDGFLAVIKSVERIAELDKETLNVLIDHIDIGEKGIDENGNNYQQIDISYKFVGKLSF